MAPPPADDDDGHVDFKGMLTTALSQQIANLATDIRDLRKEISTMREPNHQTYIAALGLLIVGGGALWTLAISPLRDAQRDAANLYAQKAVIAEQYLGMSRDIASINEHFKEFATKDDLNTLIIGIDRRLPQKP